MQVPRVHKVVHTLCAPKARFILRHFVVMMWELEIHTPTVEESQRSFAEYIQDAQRRLQHDMAFPNEPKQIRPGEDVRIVDNKISVAGQTAVMAINGLLTKVIFDKNPNHEFYVEESFPLDWMFPYLTPYGIIMKINREPVPELTEEIVKRDNEFWSLYSDRLIGNWITHDTTVAEICEFVKKTYLRRDYTGFKGDPKFVRDDNAQKAFSKLRSAIGGLYFWRVSSSKTPAEGQNGPEVSDRARSSCKLINARRSRRAKCSARPRGAQWRSRPRRIRPRNPRRRARTPSRLSQAVRAEVRRKVITYCRGSRARTPLACARSGAFALSLSSPSWMPRT